MTRSHRIAYTAGFFDGEGCIQIIRCRCNGGLREWYYVLRLTMFQRVEAPLLPFVDLYGGRIKPRTPTRGRDGHVWIASAVPAVVALEAMLPYLVLKREQAELALEFQVRREGRKGSFAPTSDVEHDKDEIDYIAMSMLKEL